MKYLFSFFGIVGVLAVGFVIYIYSEVRFDAYKIIDYKPEISSQIYDKNNNLVANIFDKNYRLYATYDEIPPRIIEALVAIEDTSYFEHSGINPEAIFRAIIKDIKAMKLVEGASTITQQLIKNMVLTREKTLIRKVKEAVLAFKIENSLTKEQIIQRYLNQVYFGHGYYGIKTAAMGYFHKNLDELSLKEISMLVGLPKAPSSYDPTKHLSLSLSRANRVLNRLHTLGWINKTQYEEGLKEQPLIYDETLTQNKAPYVVDQVIKQASSKFENIKTGGYQIHLNIDLKLQQIAQKTLNDGYKDILKRTKDQNQTKLNGAMVVLENKTGNILALVGGVDYAKSSYNRAVQSKRQPGSSFKPFLYQIALDFGYSPSSLVPDISRVYTDEVNNKTWKPKNYGNKFRGLISLKEALTYSRNLATINLANSIGLDRVHEKLEQIGFRDIPMDLSISLGSFGISLVDFAKFYTLFSNYGTINEPKLINNIKDAFGNVFEYESKSYQITSPEQAYLMIDIMKDAVQKGTGKAARINQMQVAGKTGTTNNNVDSWFCGYTPDIEVLVWYGNDDNKPMDKHQTGSKVAPVFKNFVTEYIKNYPQTRREFTRPSGVNFVNNNDDIEYFTKTSPLPKQTPKQKSQNAKSLLF